jgi:hypothetical protein|tara:strand:- start:964 stop:1332 length:369 start_codon:yes stop_codon:yes gene_type:complete
MNDLIKKKVLSRNWSFNEISNLKNTIEKLSSELYSEMKLQERFDILRELRIREDYVGFTFEDIMRQAVMASLQGEVAGTIKNMLNNATIKFGDKNEVSERSMGGESHKERSANEKENSENEE